MSRYWHQIADSLLVYTKEKAFDEGDANTDLLTLYKEMIHALATKMNPIKFAMITVNVSRQHSDIEEAIKFLQAASDILDEKRDAKLLLRIAQAEKRLDLGQHHDCLQILNEVHG